MQKRNSYRNERKKTLTTVQMILVWVPFVLFVVPFKEKRWLSSSYLVFFLLSCRWMWCIEIKKNPSKISTLFTHSSSLIDFFLLISFLCFYFHPIVLILKIFPISSAHATKNNFRYTKYGALFIFCCCLPLPRALAHSLYFMIRLYDPYRVRLNNNKSN